MYKNQKIAIVHYGCGNIYNIKKAFLQIGCDYIDIVENEPLEKYDIVILPGVGSFDNAMEHLKSNTYDLQIKEHLEKGKKLLGICLGMQLLMKSSEELKESNGLGIIEGKVLNLNRFIDNSPLPHVGINKVEESNYYFDHSYHIILEDDKFLSKSTKYENYEFISFIQDKNITAVQFHPELSGKSGLGFLKQFLMENI